MGEKKVVWFAGALHIYLLTGMGYGCMFISWPARSGALGGGKPIVFTANHSYKIAAFCIRPRRRTPFVLWQGSLQAILIPIPIIAGSVQNCLFLLPA